MFCALKRCGNEELEECDSKEQPESTTVALNKKLRIVNAPHSVYKKLLSELNVSVVKDILKYRYFLEINDTLNLEGLKLALHEEAISLIVILNAVFVSGIDLDSSGEIISIYANPKIPKQLFPESVRRHTYLNSAKFEQMTSARIRKIFKSIDQDILRSILSESFSINLHHKIICETGNIAAYNGRFIYKFVLKFRSTFNLFIDSTGNFIDISFKGDPIAWKGNLLQHQNSNLLKNINFFNRYQKFKRRF
jgi:hypothetical protein